MEFRKITESFPPTYPFPFVSASCSSLKRFCTLYYLLIARWHGDTGKGNSWSHFYWSLFDISFSPWCNQLSLTSDYCQPPSSLFLRLLLRCLLSQGLWSAHTSLRSPLILAVKTIHSYIIFYLPFFSWDKGTPGPWDTWDYLWPLSPTLHSGFTQACD